ncbi:MAG: tRNA (adenosine(37)-N6)-threonylcarbamoyltransferase complex dimerization subunit type 1 TsaB [Treponemataceae bacterium]|nr:tRNA (adenosine(37)-N6)-threonylcarbamoyltransferase complex dimerization subunit type 1 TsaB [Treponemataceae bacterium]
MKALAIDSASQIITFIAQNQDKQAEISLDIGMHQSEMILPCIEQVLSYVNLNPVDLDFSVLCLGPGTFTGLRLAFAALKALTITNNTPIYAIPSLKAYAYPYLMWSGAVISVIDAKKDRFYASIFRNNEENTEPMDVSLDEILKCIDPEEKILVVGPDAELFAESALASNPNLSITTFKNSSRSCAKSLLDLGNKKYQNNETPLQEYEGPVYIRPSEAEISKNQK